MITWKCFKDELPWSIFFVICLPCFGYASMAAFIPMVFISSVCSLSCAIFIGMMITGNNSDIDMVGGNIIKAIATAAIKNKQLINNIANTTISELNTTPSSTQSLPNIIHTPQNSVNMIPQNIVQPITQTIPQVIQQIPQIAQPVQTQYVPIVTQTSETASLPTFNSDTESYQQNTPLFDNNTNNTNNTNNQKSSDTVLNFLRTSLAVPIIFLIIYPLLWTLLMSLLLFLRKRYILNKLKAEPDKTEAVNLQIIDIEKISYAQIFSKCIPLYGCIMGITLFSLLAYHITDFILEFINSIPIIPPPFKIPLAIISYLKYKFEDLFGTNSLKLLYMTNGYGIMPLFNIIPIIGQFSMIIFLIIPPNVIISMAAFTIACKQLGFENYKYESGFFDLKEKIRNSFLC